MRMVARWLLLAIGLLLIGCGSGSDSPSASTGVAPAPPPPRDSAEGSAAVPRVVIRKANLTIRVDDAEKALESARRIAKEQGGYLESGGVFNWESDSPSAEAVLRVPEPRFDATIDRLKQLGDREYERIESEDVTLQATDLEARLKVLRAEERQYLELLGQARSVQDVLQVRSRLGEVRQQIESLDGQLKVLRNQADMSTIAATFRQRTPLGLGAQRGWVMEAWVGAWNALFAVLRWLVHLAILVVVFAVLWVPVVLLVRWSRRRGRTPPPPPPQTGPSDAESQ
ncbi:MAG: DUF4349 domain-containing protein [Fimbriimonadales bacterium]|nr:DUF4349 domain-containing protein [Fimbriimonadales bacterium]